MKLTNNNSVFLCAIALAYLAPACGRSGNSAETSDLSELKTAAIALSIGELGIDDGLTWTGGLRGCVSGMTSNIEFPSTRTASLIQGDYKCDVFVDRLERFGEVFIKDLVNGPYDPSIGAMNIFLSDSGKRIFLVPLSRLPSPAIEEHLSINLAVLSLEEGTDFQIKSRTADMVQRTGLKSWFARDGKYILDGGQQISQWRSLLGRDPILAQANRELRPKFSKKEGAVFSKGENALSYEDQLKSSASGGGLSFAVRFLVRDSRSKQALSIVSVADYDRQEVASLCLLNGKIVFQTNGSSTPFEIGDAKLNKWEAIFASTEGEVIHFWVSGHYVGAFDFGYQAASVVSVGASGGSGGKSGFPSFDGKVSDLLIWDGLLPDEARVAIFDYLAF